MGGVGVASVGAGVGPEARTKVAGIGRCASPFFSCGPGRKTSLATVTSRSTSASVPESTISCSRVTRFSAIAIGIFARWRRRRFPVEAEWLARENKRLTRALQEAKLKLSQACLEAIDYPARRELDKALRPGALPKDLEGS